LPLDSENPLNPMNRRISLVVLNDKTERQIRGLPEEPEEEINSEAEAALLLGLEPGSELGTLDGPPPDGGVAEPEPQVAQPEPVQAPL
jgi:hypothetical protein